MEKTLLFLCSLLIMLSANAQQIARPLEAPVNYIDSNFTKISIRNNSNTKLSYDTSGNLVKTNTYMNGDIVQSTTSIIDADGNLLSMSRDKDGDGKQENVSKWTYDDNGNQLTCSSSFDGGVTLNPMESNTYDEKGNILSSTRYGFSEEFILGIHTFTYDENGNQIKSAYDSGGDGVVTSITTQEFDENGNLLTLSHDVGPDGIPNRITTHTYDDKGNKLSNSYDTDADGNINNTQIFTYDENGNWLSRKDYYGIDKDLEYSITNTYDEDGYLISKDIDHDGDGYFEDTRTFKFSYFKSCETIPGLSNKVYKVSIPQKGNWVFSTYSEITDFNTKIYVGSNPCSVDLGSNSNACTDNQSEIVIKFKKAQDVYVVVNSENNETGTYQLQVKLKH